MAQQQQKTYHVYRNHTSHCYMGRGELIPAWVTMEACPPPPTGDGKCVSPGDEVHSQDGKMHMLLANPTRATITCIGPVAAVNAEMEKLKVPKAHREACIAHDCRGEMPKQDADGNPIPVLADGKPTYVAGKQVFEMEPWISQSFIGCHHIFRDVTEEFKDAIAASGESVRMTNVKNQVALSKENERLKAEKDELRHGGEHVKRDVFERRLCAALKAQGKSPLATGGKPAQGARA